MMFVTQVSLQVAGRSKIHLYWRKSATNNLFQVEDLRGNLLDETLLRLDLTGSDIREAWFNHVHKWLTSEMQADD